MLDMNNTARFNNQKEQDRRKNFAARSFLIMDYIKFSSRTALKMSLNKKQEPNIRLLLTFFS